MLINFDLNDFITPWSNGYKIVVNLGDKNIIVVFFNEVVTLCAGQLSTPIKFFYAHISVAYLIIKANC